VTARRGLVTAGIAVVALVGAWVVTETAPSAHDWLDPIPVTATVGEEAVGRNLAATVHDVTAAETVIDTDGAEIETGGVWVVVDASARAVISERAVNLGGTRLVVDGVEYSPSDRVDRSSTFAGRPLSIGIDLRGALVFELPAVPDEAELRLGPGVSAGPVDLRGDSVLVVPIDLEGREPEASVTLPTPALESE